MNTFPRISTIGVGIGAVAILAITFYYVRRKRQNQIPKPTWQHIGTLKEIVFYPLKSSSPVALQEAYCEEFGLSKFGFQDRRLVLINEANGGVLYVGYYPLMLSLNIKVVSDGCLVVTAPNKGSITLNLSDFGREQKTMLVQQMNGYRLNLIEGKADQHIWFSRVIVQKDRGLKLYLTTDIILETIWWRGNPNNFLPIMAIHDKSVNELNSKLEEKDRVHQQQFRGNLFIESLSSVEPFDEDKWLWVKIGKNPRTATILRYNSPCFRIIDPNIFSYKPKEPNEPLKKLRNFRLHSHPENPEMGIFFDVYKEGFLKCGDMVFVQYK